MNDEATDDEDIEDDDKEEVDEVLTRGTKTEVE